MRCSARRRRAAATISIARVIFWMFLTDPMRALTSLRAMRSRRSGGRRLLLARSLAVAVAALAALLVGQRLALLVEVVAEVLGELGDRVVELVLDVVGPVAVGDRLQRVRDLGVQALDERAVVLLDAPDVDAVDVAVRRGVHDRDLVLGRHGLA